MIVTVTSIRLRKWWYFFRLSYFGLLITKQLQKEKGFIKLKNTGFGLMHYTLSAWESEQDVKRFYKQGAHLDAMKKSSSIATETKTYTYQSEKMPDWPSAKELLKANGRVVRWN